MKICPHCSREHEKPGTFCSRSCVNRHRGPRSPETVEKIRASNVGKKRSTQADKDRYAQLGKRRSESCLEAILNEETENLSPARIKKKLFFEQRGCCARCQRSEWLEAPIPLELEHKDGNKQNNSRDNVELLCPNCHALTPTWRRAKSHPRWKMASLEGIEPPSKV